MAQMKMKQKITLGFAVVIALLITVGLVGTVFLTQGTSMFVQYREWARDSNLMAQTVNELLNMRLTVKNFVISGDAATVEQFDRELDSTRGFLQTAVEEIQAEERAPLVAHARSKVDEYGTEFDVVVDLQRQRNEYVAEMDVLGPELEQNLTRILVSARNDNDMTAAYFASLATRNLLLARLYAFKFLDSNIQDDLDRAKSEVAGAVENLVILDAELQNVERRALLEEVTLKIVAYEAALDSAAAAIFERNDHIVNGLDVIGPRIAADSEEVMLSITADQDTLGPQLQRRNSMASIVVIIVSVIALVSGVFLAILISRSILRQLGADPAAIEGIMKRLASRDLQIEIQTDSATGVYRSIGEMIGSLNGVLSSVEDSVDQVTSGADQVAQSSESLAQGSTEQASSLEEVSASLNEINSQSTQNAESTSEASSVAKGALDSAQNGNQKMEALVGAMERINDSSEEITKVVKVIDDIAFQINLLALNANVEAARAGKYGKGFAVVAEEVRNLAVRSAEAAKETTAMVETTTKNVQEGNTAAHDTSGQLQEIVTGVTKVADFLEEIALASKEQAEGVEQINQGLAQIDQVTQSNTANAEESSAASEELAGQAQTLRSLVSTFKLARKLNSERMQLSELAVSTGGGSNGNGHDDPSSTKIALASSEDERELIGAAATSDSGGRRQNPKDVVRLDDDDFGQF